MTNSKHRRWSFYTLMIWSAFNLVAIAVFVPETYHPVVLRTKARKMRLDTGDSRYFASIEKMDKSIAHTVMWSTIRPFQLLILEPMCLNLCIFSAILCKSINPFPMVVTDRTKWEFYTCSSVHFPLYFKPIIDLSNIRWVSRSLDCSVVWSLELQRILIGTRTTNGLFENGRLKVVSPRTSQNGGYHPQFLVLSWFR